MLLIELSNHSTLQVLKRKEGLDGAQTTSIGECLRNVGVEGAAQEETKVSEQGRRCSRETSCALGCLQPRPRMSGGKGLHLLCAITTSESYSLQHSLLKWERLQARLLDGKAVAGIKLANELLDSIAFVSLPS